MSESKECPCGVCKPYGLEENYFGKNCTYSAECNNNAIEIEATINNNTDSECKLEQAKDDSVKAKEKIQKCSIEYKDCDSKCLDCDSECNDCIKEETAIATIANEFAEAKSPYVKSYDAKSDEKSSIRTLMNNYLYEIKTSKGEGSGNAFNMNAVAKIQKCNDILKNNYNDDEYYKCLTRYDPTFDRTYPPEYYKILGIKDLVPKGGKKHSKKRKNKSNKKHKKSKKNSSIKKRGNKQKRTKKSKN
jgi:hypothetical protein